MDRLSLLHTDAYQEQFGNRYASTVWRFWNIIDLIDGISSLFPYLLIYRTEEDAGSSPARSTELPYMEYLHRTGCSPVTEEPDKRIVHVRVRGEGSG